MQGFLGCAGVYHSSQECYKIFRLNEMFEITIRPQIITLKTIF